MEAVAAAVRESDEVILLRQELARRIDLHVGPETKVNTAIDGLTLVRRVIPDEFLCASYQPSVAVIAQGRKRVHLGPSTLVYDESRFLLTALDLPVVSEVLGASATKPFLAMSLRLDMTIVRELLAHIDVPLGNASTTPAMTTSEVTPELLGACNRLLDLLGTPADIPILSPLTQREILYRLLRSPEGARLRAIATLGDQSQRTAKAIAWIRTNYARPLRVEELAAIAGMGVSTFHHHFRSLTAMSPLQYQKMVRLQAARSLMLVEKADAASAAFAVGYESASQFSREYSRLFGQPPAQDVKRSRRAS